MNKRIYTQIHGYLLLSMFILAESYPCSLPVVLEPVTLFCERPLVVSLLILLAFFYIHFSLCMFASFKKSPGEQWVRKENVGC